MKYYINSNIHINVKLLDNNCDFFINIMAKIKKRFLSEHILI